MNGKKHGGSRQGAGRPAITPNEPKIKTYSMLRPSIRKFVEDESGGNLSAGIETIAIILMRSRLFEKLGGHGIYEDDAYDGLCPVCGEFAVYWQADVEKWIANPSEKYACVNGHAR